MPEGTRRDGGENCEATGDDVNLLAMQMQLNQFQPGVSASELWTIWCLVDSMCYDLNGRDNHGVPPIIYAAKVQHQRGSVVLLRLFLNYHADVNALSEIRETAVMAACRKQRIGAVKFLVKRGAKLDLCDKSQFSALRWAATHGNVPLVRLLLHHSVSVRIDCCTPNSALEIALSYPTKAHAKIVLLLQRQLVIERRKLLEDVIKQKQQEEINLIKKHRRQMNRLRRQAGVKFTSTADQEVKLMMETVPAKRSPFALPIVPSLKRKKPKSYVSDRRPTEETAFSSSKGNSSDSQSLNRLSSLRGLLEVQLLAPPATIWTKVGFGVWRQVEARPWNGGSILTDGDAVTSFTPASHDISQKQIHATVQEIVATEGKWQAFMAETNHIPNAVCGHEAAWELENLES